MLLATALIVEKHQVRGQPHPVIGTVEKVADGLLHFFPLFGDAQVLAQDEHAVALFALGRLIVKTGHLFLDGFNAFKATLLDDGLFDVFRFGPGNGFDLILDSLVKTPAR